MRENSKLDEIEKYIHNKLESIESFTQVCSESKDQNMLHKVNDLNQLCNELNEKIDNSRHTTHHRSPQIADLEDFITTKINSLESSSSTDNVTLTNRISKLEELCNNMNRKFDSFTIQRPPNSHCNPIPQVTPNASHQFASNTTSFSPSYERHQASNHHITQGSTYPTSTTPRDLLILGDSNCKYIKIDNSYIRTTRIPTYRIGDINPENCIGYSRVWIHVGINDLKTRNCRGPTDVHIYHKLLLHKLHRISQVCPNSKLIVSPILPTGVPALNDRARLFTNLLYTGPRWFDLLDLKVYCGADGGLKEMYRCYSNRRDRIHIGRVGIELLRNIVISCISKVDTRSYSTVLQTGQPQNYRS